jgi:hypothetical protein
MGNDREQDLHERLFKLWAKVAKLCIEGKRKLTFVYRVLACVLGEGSSYGFVELNKLFADVVCKGKTTTAWLVPLISGLQAIIDLKPVLVEIDCRVQGKHRLAYLYGISEEIVRKAIDANDSPFTEVHRYRRVEPERARSLFQREEMEYVERSIHEGKMLYRHLYYDEVPVLSAEIDADVLPRQPFEHGQIKSHTKQGKIVVEKRGVLLFLCGFEVALYRSARGENDYQGRWKSIEGYEPRLKGDDTGKTVLNANLLDFLEANPEFIPEGWEEQTSPEQVKVYEVPGVIFWGTTYDIGGGLSVRTLRGKKSSSVSVTLGACF